MENYLMINGKKIELSEELVKQIAEAREKKSPFDRANKGERYYLVKVNGCVADDMEEKTTTDNARYETANYCTDKELMKKFACYDELHRLLRRFSYQHGGDTAWDGKNHHYSICYDGDKFCTSFWTLCRSLEKIYFSTEQLAERAIEEVIKPYVREHKEFFPGIEVE